MSEPLTEDGYEQTKVKLRELQSRLAEIKNRTDLSSSHLASVRRSYNSMIRQYLEEIRLYEVKHGKPENPAAA